MAGLTWLHLSDWRQKGEDFNRDVVRDALIKCVNRRKKSYILASVSVSIIQLLTITF